MAPRGWRVEAGVQRGQGAWSRAWRWRGWAAWCAFLAAWRWGAACRNPFVELAFGRAFGLAFVGLAFVALAFVALAFVGLAFAALAFVALASEMEKKTY